MVEATYLSDVVARYAQEYQNLRLKVVQLVNDNGMLVIGGTGGNSTSTTPSQVMMIVFWCLANNNWQKACSRVRLDGY